METNVPNTFYMESSPASPRNGTRHQNTAPLTPCYSSPNGGVSPGALTPVTCWAPGQAPAPGEPSPRPGCFRCSPGRRSPRRGAGRGRGRRHAPAGPDPSPRGRSFSGWRRKISFHFSLDAPLRGRLPSRPCPPFPTPPGRLTPTPTPPHHTGMSAVPGAAPSRRTGLPCPRPGRAQGDEQGYGSASGSRPP